MSTNSNCEVFNNNRRMSSGSAPIFGSWTVSYIFFCSDFLCRINHRKHTLQFLKQFNSLLILSKIYSSVKNPSVRKPLTSLINWWTASLCLTVKSRTRMGCVVFFIAIFAALKYCHTTLKSTVNPI
ncbi:hypothetical protein D3C80_1738460 [compost metagenome]